MSIISSIQENGGLFKGGLIGALFGKKGDGGESCAGGSCGGSKEASTSSSCANGSCSGGAKGPSNEMLASRPGGSGGCANGMCG